MKLLFAGECFLNLTSLMNAPPPPLLCPLITFKEERRVRAREEPPPPLKQDVTISRIKHHTVGILSASLSSKTLCKIIDPLAANQPAVNGTPPPLGHERLMFS